MLTPPVNSLTVPKKYCCLCKKEVGKTKNDLPAADIVNIEFQDMITKKWHIGATLICFLCLRGMHEAFEKQLTKAGRTIIPITPQIVVPNKH